MPSIAAPPVIEARQQFVIPGVSWEQYVQISDALGERGGAVRTSYDGENLELMSTSQLHEWLKEMLGKFLTMFEMERNLSIKSAGGMTFRRADLERALEPDLCYWIANEHAMRHVWEADFRVHPPPDLCVEIEVSRTVVNRLVIDAELGVPEVWRVDADSLTVLRLTDGAYQAVEASTAIPDFPVAEVSGWLDASEDVDAATRVRRFVEFVRGSE